jgi:hypothetical protein
MLISVILERISKRIRQIRRIIINTIFRLSQRNRRISVLFNINIKDNFIFQRLTVKINLPSKYINRSGVTVDRYKIYIYSRYQLSTVTINSYKKQKELDQLYYAINLKHYNIILEWIWLEDTNPDVKFRRAI